MRGDAQSSSGGFVKSARRLHAAVRLDVFVGMALALTLIFLLGANCVLDHPRYPPDLPPALVPARPPLIRIINSAGIFLKHCCGLDPAPLDADAAIENAMRSAGVDYDGDQSYRDGIRALVDSIKHDSQLSLMGRIVVNAQFARFMQSRLRLLNYLKSPHGSEALDRDSNPIVRPVFIVGLPRTGTSLMHKMLSAGSPSRWRSPEHWELVHPVPLPASNVSPAQQQTLDVAQFELEAVKQLAPGIDRFHPMNVHAPEEDIVMLASDFHSLMFTTTAHVPGYLKYLNRANYTATLEFHYMFLQHLQAADKQKGRRWLLKAPQWCQTLGELVEKYPDAVVINTHRNPHRVLASFSALAAKLSGINTDDLNTTGIGAAQQDYWEQSSMQLFLWRTSAGPQFNCRPGDITVHPSVAGEDTEAIGKPCRILDVHHSQMKDSDRVAGDVLRKILAFVGAKLTESEIDEEVRRMLAFKNEYGNNKHKGVKFNRTVFGFPETDDFLENKSYLMQYYTKYAPQKNMLEEWVVA